MKDLFLGYNNPADAISKKDANVAGGYVSLDGNKQMDASFIPLDYRKSQGYIFDGIDDYLTIPHNDRLNFGADDFSIQCCFTISPSSKDQIIAQKVSSISPYYVGFSLVKSLDNSLAFRIGTIELSTRVILARVVRTTSYNLIAVRSEGLIKCYLDGILVATNAEITIGSINNSENLFIGSGGTTDYLSSKISLLRLFNRGLSQADVAYYNNSGRPELCRLQYADVITNYGELIVNGNFETNYGWVLDVDWTINNGKLVGSNTSTESYGGEIYRLNLRGKRVRLSFISTITGGRIKRISMIGVSYFYEIDTTGTYVKEFLNKGKYADSLYILGENFTGSIDNVSVKQVGCVLELLPENALPDRWLESANGLDAITSGNPAINTETPITYTQIIDNITNNIATGVTNRDYTLPAGYLVDSVCVKSTVSLTALQLVNVSTSETLLTGKTVSSAAGKHLPITNDQSSSATDTTLRLNADGNAALGFNIIINIKKCV